MLEARRKAGEERPEGLAVAEMRGLLGRLGYAATDLDRLRGGTRGRYQGQGSTCAFVDSILSRYRASSGGGSGGGLPAAWACSRRPTSWPSARRIRLDSTPLSEDDFARYFFEVWDRLGSSRKTGTEAGTGRPEAEAGRGAGKRLRLRTWLRIRPRISHGRRLCRRRRGDPSRRTPAT